MPLIHVAGEDPRLTPYRDLHRANPSRASGRFIAEGKLLVERLLTSRFRAESILVRRSRAEEIAAVAPPEIPIYVASNPDLETIVGFNFHRGVLACGLREPERPLGPSLFSGPGLVVGLIDIHDPENVGGILRSAGALGASGAAIHRASADPFSRRVLRVSMGAVFKLPVSVVMDPVAEVQSLRAAGVETIATVLDESAEPLESIAPQRPTLLLFGNEGQGLPPEVVAACTRRATIPMRSGVDSLNVAAAAAICLYELSKATR